MRKLAAYFVCLTLVFMPMTSCMGAQLTPQAGQTLHAEVDAQQRDGLITPAKATALHEAIDGLMSEQGIDWETILYTVGGAALTAITGVRISRGPAKPMDKSQAQELKDMLAERRASKEAEGEVGA
jgi:hypothetical protein